MIGYADCSGAARQLLTSPIADVSLGTSPTRRYAPPSLRLTALADGLARRMEKRPSLVLTPFEGIELVRELAQIGGDVRMREIEASRPRSLRARLAAFIRRLS